MNTKPYVAAALAAFALAGCGGGGDIELSTSTVDNSVDNSVNQGNGGSANPCASYTDPDSEQLVRGSFDGTNCTYSANFVGVSRPLTVDLTIPFISGVHIFQDSLFVGENVSTGVAPADGTGPTLTIEAGNTLAFQDSADYVLINRGSRIVANGASSAPITLTGYTDAVTGTAGPEDVQLWGGLVINGNGITNNCTEAQRLGDQCHVVSEGQPSNYGGNDNEESSGSLRYVIVKHTGFEVAPGDELNGVTFNAVGSGTVVENLQVYSTYDDGVEFFGGAVDVRNLVALYVRDDSIDFSDGWVGSIENALVIHSANDGDRCIEGDNIGDTRAAAGEALDTAPLTAPVVSNLTCIMSGNDAGTHGDSEGVLIRRGAAPDVRDSLLYSGYAASVLGRTSNECYEFNDDLTLAQAAAGSSRLTNSVIACEEATKGNLPNGDSLEEWVLAASPSTNGADYGFNAGNLVFGDPAAPMLALLVPGSYLTSTSPTDDAGAPLAVTPASGRLGAVEQGADWTAPWAYGLRPGNRAQALWFE